MRFAHFAPVIWCICFSSFIPRPVAGQEENDPPRPVPATATPLKADGIGEKLPTPDPVQPASATEPADEKEIYQPSTDLEPTATDPEARRLQSIVIRIWNALDVERIPDPELAKNDLEVAMVQLENYVGDWTENGGKWGEFLRLKEIREELEERAPNTKLLAEIEANMRQNYVGLENLPFTNLRESLRRYRLALTYGGSRAEPFAKFLEAQLQAFFELLEKPREGAGSERAEQIARLANFLFDSNQQPWMVAELVSEHHVPNVQIYAKESLVNQLVSRAVDEPSPVNEIILGTRIIGRARLNGSVSADVLPMQQGVALNLNLTGNLSSSNRGFNRGVVLQTSSSSPILASKNVVVTEYGASSRPATIATNLSSSVDGIEHRLRIVRRIAARKAAEQKPQADAIAEGRMQRRVSSQYDAQVEEQLAEINARLATAKSRAQGRPEFTRLEVPRPEYAVYSTNSTVHANVIQAAAYQLAADRPCPIPRPKTSQVVVELHQSFFINAFESLLSNRTIHHHDIDDLAQQFLGETPPAATEATEGEPFSVTFTSFNPVQVELDNNTVGLTLRFAALYGEESIENGAIVKVVYQPRIKQGILTLQRIDEIDVSVQGRLSSVQRASLNGALRAKLKELLPEVIESEQMDLGDQFPNAANFKLNWLKIDDGWVQLGVR